MKVVIFKVDRCYQDNKQISQVDLCQENIQADLNSRKELHL